MGNEAVTPAPTCWVSAEPRRTEGERSSGGRRRRRRRGGGGGSGALRAAPPAAHALRPPARCGRLPRRPCRERPPVRVRVRGRGRWARRAPLRRPRGAAGMGGAGRRPPAPALGLALLLAACLQVWGCWGGGGGGGGVFGVRAPFSSGLLAELLHPFFFLFSFSPGSRLPPPLFFIFFIFF